MELGYQQALQQETLTISTSSVGLTASKYSDVGEGRVDAKIALSSVETASIRVTFDGTTPVAAATGHLIAADTFVGRTLTGTSNQVSISNGDGVSENPTFSTPQNIHTATTPQHKAPKLMVAEELTARRKLHSMAREAQGKPTFTTHVPVVKVVKPPFLGVGRAQPWNGLIVFHWALLWALLGFAL